MLFTLDLADQTPTPTRLIRNLDESGVFEDLQRVNPFEEKFRLAVESKSTTTLNPIGNSGEETLHTPQVYFSIIQATDTAEKKNDKEDASVVKINECKSKPNTPRVILPNPGFIRQNSSKVKLDTPKTIKSAEITPNGKLIPITISSIPAQVLAVPPVVTVYKLPQNNLKVILAPNADTKSNLVANGGVKSHAPKPLKRLCPKEIKPSIAEKRTPNPVKEKLKEILLKTKMNTVISKNINFKLNEQKVQEQVRSVIVMRPKPSPIIFDTTNKHTKIKISPPRSERKQTQTNHTSFERNREAAKRYRNKLKNWHSDIKEKNLALEVENARLRTELDRMRAILMTHQDCSVSRALKLSPIVLESVLHENVGDGNQSQPIYYLVQNGQTSLLDKVGS